MTRRVRAAELLAAQEPPPVPLVADAASADRVQARLDSAAAAAGVDLSPAAPPTPREGADLFARVFAGQANHLAAQFGGQLWLVGSMLTSDAPGDIDLRLAITREDLCAWFGDDNIDCVLPWGESSYRRAREELKVSRRMTRRWCARSNGKRSWATRVDFQFWICLFGEDGNPIGGETKGPRLRLDTLPPGFIDVGRGEP